jgi:hypothetical protein
MTDKVSFLRHRPAQRHLNHIGPGGGVLHETEAQAYFPDFDEAPTPYAGEIKAGFVARLRVRKIWFTVKSIEASQETGVFFGVVVEDLPGDEDDPKGNIFLLKRDHCIGFEARHVFDVADPGELNDFDLADLAGERGHSDFCRETLSSGWEDLRSEREAIAFLSSLEA